MEPTPPILFDRARLRKRRKRVSAHFPQHDFMWREAALRAEESLSFIARPFPRMLSLGPAPMAARAGTEHWVRMDEVAGMLSKDASLTMVADYEMLPFADSAFDAVVSLLSLHTVNDLPGTLAQIRRVLKPDGLFFAILPGGESLRELRSIFAQVEEAQTGGLTPRIAPFIDVRDAGALLQRAGFALPVADSEILQVSYENLFALMDDLRGSGEANMLQQCVQHFTPRKFFLEAAKRYAEQFADGEGRITATAEFITLTGWAPAANQQQPAKRGSGKISMATIFN